MVAENKNLKISPRNNEPDGPCCGSCRFFVGDKLKHGAEGVCKFNPPIVFPNPIRKPITNEIVMGQIQFFPWMTAAGWYGQWRGTI